MNQCAHNTYPPLQVTLISLIAEEVGINIECGIFWKKLVHSSAINELKKSINVEGGKLRGR